MVCSHISGGRSPILSACALARALVGVSWKRLRYQALKDAKVE